MRAVSYEDQKRLIRSQVASQFDFDFDNKLIIMESIVEKIMAREFNQTFYRGEGETTSTHMASSPQLNYKTRTVALLRGLGTTLFAIKEVLLQPKKSRSAESIGWVYAIPSQFFATTNEIRDLVEFLDSTLSNREIEPPSKYLLQSGSFQNQIESERIHVVPHIGSKILSMESESRIKTVREVINRTLFWLKTSMSHPIFVLIGPEYIVEVPAIKLRINCDREVLITTQSQLLATPLVFKSSMKVSRVMYWYSNNSFQISKQTNAEIDYSYLTQPEISEHFVWTSTWGKILQEHNPDALVTVIGPIIFTKFSKLRKSDRKIRPHRTEILIFDITPKKNAGTDSIYSDHEMIDFVSDIIAVANAKYPDVLIKLKPKRKYTSNDSVVYSNFLESQSSNVQILKWNTDIGIEILNSDLVICIPFSSPALIAKFLDIPRVFYTPSVDFKLERIHEDILVLQGLSELQSFLAEFDNQGITR